MIPFLVAVYSFVYGILIFALAGEADSGWLRVVGIVAASWMILAGAVQGWLVARSNE